MRERFTNEVMMKLADKVSDAELQTIRGCILAVLSNYDITARETAVALYKSYVPRFYEMYLATLKINGRSIGTIKTYNFHLIDFFINLSRPVNEITSADIYAYLFALQEKGTVSNRTIDHVRIIINTFLEWATTEGYIERNACRSIRPITYRERPRQPLTDIELEMVRDACRTERESAIVETLYSTGCRVTELAILEKGSVNFADRAVTLLGKGNKYRVSFLNARAELMLRKYLKTRTDDCPALIVTERKPIRPLTKETYEKIVHDIGERAMLKRPLTPHVFRHTFATNLVRRGASIEDVQKLLGHEKTSTTMIYTKIDLSAVKRNHEKYIV